MDEKVLIFKTFSRNNEYMTRPSLTSIKDRAERGLNITSSQFVVKDQVTDCEFYIYHTRIESRIRSQKRHKVYLHE